MREAQPRHSAAHAVVQPQRGLLVRATQAAHHHHTVGAARGHVQPVRRGGERGGLLAVVLPRGLGRRRLQLGRLGGVAAAVVELVRPERAVGTRGEEGEAARPVEREPRGHGRERERGGLWLG